MSLEASWYARTLCHEMAHANGWAMDHPGGSFLSDARAGVDPHDVPPPRAVLASLSSDRPLRKASESPAYLAFAAAQAGVSMPGDTFAATVQLASLDASVPVNNFGTASAVTITASRTPDLLLAALSYEAAPSLPGRSLVFAAQTTGLHDQRLGDRPHLVLAAASINKLSARQVSPAASGQVQLHQAALTILPPAVPAQDPKPSAPLWLARAVRGMAEDTFAAVSVALRAAVVGDQTETIAAEPEPAQMPEPEPEPAPEATPPAPSAKPALRPTLGSETTDKFAAGV